MPLLDTINAKLLEEQKERQTRVRSGKFNPSLFGYCYRRQIYNRLDFPVSNPMGVDILRRFKAGVLFEEYYFSFFPKIERQVKCETNDILGYADGVTDDEVIETKSQHSRKFWHLAKTKGNIVKTERKNILQLMFYVIFLKKSKGRLIYISKDDLFSNEYLFYPQQWEKEIQEEIDNLLNYWLLWREHKQLPPAEPRAFEGKECQYCPFEAICKETENTNR